MTNSNDTPPSNGNNHEKQPGNHKKTPIDDTPQKKSSSSLPIWLNDKDVQFWLLAVLFIVIFTFLSYNLVKYLNPPEGYSETSTPSQKIQLTPIPTITPVKTGNPVTTDTPVKTGKPVPITVKPQKEDDFDLPEIPAETWNYIQSLQDKVVDVKKVEPKTDSNVRYHMQCGAFKRAEQAEERRALLALMGFNAESTKAGDWYRVSLPSYDNKRQAERDLRALGDQHIECRFWPIKN